MRIYGWMFVALALAACDDGADPTGDPLAVDQGASPTDGSPPTDAFQDGAPGDATADGATATDDGAPPADLGPRDGGPAPDAESDLGALDAGPLGEPAPLPSPPQTGAVSAGGFASSPVCGACHTAAAGAQALRDGAGRAVGPFDLWQSSMMANSARDPLWRATMSAEVATNPGAEALIEAKCLNCHAPAGWRAAGDGADVGLLDAASPEGQIARDGVNCTTCHQIPAEGLGSEAVFSGQWAAGDAPVAYGPHANPFANPMVSNSGFTPVQADHVTESVLCSSCHVLETPTLDDTATPTGHTLLEQATFLEWRNSAFEADGVTCQACHLPSDDADGDPIRTAIARRPNGGDFPQVAARAPIGRHLLVGGNTLILQVLRDFGAELATQAPREAFEATLAATRDSLASAARLELSPLTPVGDGVELSITVHNQTGHKLPSGFPSRRVWLHLTALDAAGAVVFESGRPDAEGRLLVGDAVADFERAGGPVQGPHQTIDRPDQVQVWAAQMCDPQGQPTWRLLRGSAYCRDNRLLPRGWRADHPDGPATAPTGVADDPDFQPGADTVIYRLPARTARVEAVLHHQPLDARFAAELFLLDTPEIRALRYYLARVDQTPAVIARAAADR